MTRSDVSSPERGADELQHSEEDSSSHSDPKSSGALEVRKLINESAFMLCNCD